MKHFYLIAALCVTGFAPAKSFASDKNMQAGNYLASRFAQNNHDWKSANDFINKILKVGIATDGILKRAMILSMGSGNGKEAIEIIKHIKQQDKNKSNAIMEVFLIADAFKNEDYKLVKKILAELPNDSTSRFISPFIKGWVNAALGSLDIKDLKNNSVQLYHGILISDFLNDHTYIEKVIDKSLQIDNINIAELEQIAGLYGHIGLKEKSLKTYNLILEKVPEYEAAKNKIDNIKQDKEEPLFINIKTAKQGMAKAFHDIANILRSEQNDETARIFANISLYLYPDMTETKFLLAKIDTSHNQYQEAINYYNSIPKSDSEYIKAQYNIVDIYEDTKRFNDAISLLSRLPQDIDTIIKIGNLHRSQSNFGLALEAYDKAAEKLGGIITKEYWHLAYVRGIAYEQLDNWDKAEEALKIALNFQPEHPYILNYLGYAWADKGINLDESLKMIRKAVSLRPNDGYITDSLGWVMYKTKDYYNAVPILEQAALLLPYDPTVNDHLGDAYWQVGRKLEANFQWKRAINNSKDSKQIKKIENKLNTGILK